MKNTMLALLSLSLLAAGARAEVDKKVERTFKAKCASCHGADGAKLPFKKVSTDAQFKAAIENGVPKSGDKDAMDSYKDKGVDVDGLVAYARTLAK